ncbi:MAG: hypothetical protein JW829_13805 [Pirellulales bacterium]|nr:hypothetical protein [Pirellulales bacterium]
MTKKPFFIVDGMGPDAVGLVGRIASPIAGARGNIVDLRQDVLHGLFTFHMVVDLTESQLDYDGFKVMLAEIGEATGLKIGVDAYTPAPRNPDKKNLLVILIGKDKPGIIASSAEMLGKYNANIEFAQTIGREDVFLMELLTDVSHTSIPVENLKRSIQKNMEAIHIKTIFQDEHVFIKRKRILLFNIASSFIARDIFDEIIEQTGLDPKQVASTFSGKSSLQQMQKAAEKLDGLSLDAVHDILQGIVPTPGSVELIQTLKVMGYKVALASTGFAFFTEYLRHRLNLDHAFGIPLAIDDDARTILGELQLDQLGSHDIDSVLTQLVHEEKVDQDDITILTDEGCPMAPGIRLTFDLDVLLSSFNQRILSPGNILGFLGSFGVPHFESK